MPELPEVEILARRLNKGLPKSSTVIRALKSDKKLKGPTKSLKLFSLESQVLRKVSRRAKYLLFQFDEMVMISHLGMTGDWRIERQYKAKKHDHVILELSQRSPNSKRHFLVFNDPRRFGSCSVVESSALAGVEALSVLGPEPLDGQLTAKVMADIATNKKQPAKVFLLDQRNIAGIGNIYASEILHLAKVSPFLPAKDIPKKSWSKIIASIDQVLNEAIANGESYQEEEQRFRVYNREHEACNFCEASIVRTIQASRSTYYCPCCQC